MKKSIFLIVLLIACISLVLVACDDNKQGNDPVDTGAQTTAPSDETQGEGTNTPSGITPGENTTAGETETEPHVHNYEEWEMLKQASCTEQGEKVRYCSCGEQQGGVIAATGHTEVTDEAVEPTCSTSGLTEGKHCSVCNEILEAQIQIPAIGKHSGKQKCDSCGLDYFEELAGIIVRNGIRNEYGTMVYQYYSNNSVKVTFYYTTSGKIEVGVITSTSGGTYNFYLIMTDAMGNYNYSSLALLSSYYVMYDIEGTLSASSNSKDKASLHVSASSKENCLTGAVYSLTTEELSSCTDTDSSAMKLVLQKMDELLKKQSEIDITYFGFN